MIRFAQALSAAAVSTLVHRVALRRTPAVLIGPASQVAELEQRWSDRRDVEVVDTDRWASALDMSDHRPGVVTDVDHTPSSCVRVASTTSPAFALAKSTMDRLGAATALVVLAPLLLAIAVAVRWDSHGPAVFSQVRTGRDGQPFRMFKFRSMVVDAEHRLGDLMDRNEAEGPLFKIVDDPRITAFGRFLRRSSLDELLQLVNVVKGEMSLVGPRPALPRETASYDPWTWHRLHVKPGLTGLWQVSGRSTLTWEESVRKDLEYVNNQSLRLDLSILGRTIGAVFGGEGAH